MKKEKTITIIVSEKELLKAINQGFINEGRPADDNLDDASLIDADDIHRYILGGKLDNVEIEID